MVIKDVLGSNLVRGLFRVPPAPEKEIDMTIQQIRDYINKMNLGDIQNGSFHATIPDKCIQVRRLIRNFITGNEAFLSDLKNDGRPLFDQLLDLNPHRSKVIIPEVQEKLNTLQHDSEIRDYIKANFDRLMQSTLLFDFSDGQRVYLSGGEPPQYFSFRGEKYNRDGEKV